MANSTKSNMTAADKARTATKSRETLMAENEARAAAAVPPASKFSRIRINNVSAGGSTPVSINGEVRRIPHNSDAVVDQYELEVLENSSVDITVVGDATKTQADKAGAAARSRFVDDKAAPYEQPAGGDYLPKPGPDEELAVTARTRPMLGDEPYEQPRGGDYLVKTDAAATVTDDDRDAAREQRDTLAAGEQEPAVELTNADPHQVRLQAAGGPIGATDTGDRGSGENRPAPKAKAAPRKAPTKAKVAAKRNDVLPVEERGEKAKGGLISNLKKRLG